MHILQISRHSPESCAMFNQRSRATTITILKAMDKLLEKHGVKLLCTWNDVGAHEVFSIFETPSMEAFMALCTEPEMTAWIEFNSVQNRVVQGMGDVRVMLGLG